MAETCPHCGHETEADVCPLCGSELPGPGSAAREPAGAASGQSGGGAEDRDPAGAGARQASGEGRALPWEDPSQTFPTDLWRTWSESLFSPGRFFGRVGDRGSLARPILYFLLVSVAGAVFTLVWQTVWFSGPGTVYAGGAGALAHPAVSFFLAPFLALIGLAVTTVIYHLGALVLAPDRRGMAGTARVICYAAGPSVLAVVPFLGSLAAAVWTLVLQVVGLREVHRTTTGRAVLMVFWLWAVLFALFVLGAVILGLVAGTGVTDAAREGLVGSLFPAG